MAGAKYGHLMLPGTFPDKVTPDIGFTDEGLVPVMFLLQKYVIGNGKKFKYKF